MELLKLVVYCESLCLWFLQTCLLFMVENFEVLFVVIKVAQCSVFQMQRMDGTVVNVPLIVLLICSNRVEYLVT